MRLMRLVPIYQEPNTSKKNPAHKIWPYLLKDLSIERPNQVWCVDITYVPMQRGFVTTRLLPRLLWLDASDDFGVSHL